STAKRSLSSSSLLFASCFESYAIQDDVPGQTLRLVNRRLKTPLIISIRQGSFDFDRVNLLFDCEDKKMTKCALVCGAGGFIGGHLVKRLKKDDFWVRGVDLKFHEFAETNADDFVIGDLRDQGFCRTVVDRRFDEVYQLAADMGGAGYIFTGEHDADVMHNSATINLNVLDACHKRGVKQIFYSSSACLYPAYNQEDRLNPKCSEDSAYPAAPDSEYGWEKLFSERLYLAYRRNYGMQTHVARYHNIFGPEGTWNGGREKAP